MQVFVFYDEFFAFYHVFAIEELLEIGLELLDYLLDSSFYGLYLWQISIFDFFIELEDLEHERTVFDLDFFVDHDSFELHQIYGSL